MPNFLIYVDIDIEEFIESCSNKDIKELIEILEDDEYIKPNSSMESKNSIYHMESECDIMILKIAENKHQISIEDENLIRCIYKKLA